MAVAFDAKTSTFTNGTTTTLSVTNLTVGPGSNRALGVFIEWNSGSGSLPPGLSVVWDSVGANQALTQVANTLTSNGTTSMTLVWFALIAPTSGNKTLSISWTGNLEGHATAISMTGVDQTSVAAACLHGAVHNASSASPCSVTVTSAVGNLVLAGHSQDVGPFGAISGTTIATDDVTGPNNGVTSNYASGAASVTMTAAFTGSGSNASSGFDVLAAAGAADTLFAQAVM